MSGETRKGEFRHATIPGTLFIAKWTALPTHLPVVPRQTIPKRDIEKANNRGANIA